MSVVNSEWFGTGTISDMDWYSELEARAVSQKELADRTGLSPTTVSRIVTGRRRGWPSTRRTLANALLESPPIFEVAQEQTP